MRVIFMIRIFPIYLLLALLFPQCKNLEPTVNLAKTNDPDIVLVNIEDGDRSFISKVLLKIDSLKPILIGINVYFIGNKSKSGDSLLVDALKKIDNDYLIYGPNKHSDSTFTLYCKNQGVVIFDRTFGLISKMRPLPKIGQEVHESFAYMIARNWKPDIKPDFLINEEIPINYQRKLESYLRLDGSFLLETNIDNFDLQNKIFLVGYLGPGKEDKFSTPLRLVGKELNNEEPDTYGTVIIANQIRTILEYRK